MSYTREEKRTRTYAEAVDPAVLEERILCPELFERVMSAQEAACGIRSGMTIGLSGFGLGHPKAIPNALAELGEAKELSIISAAASDEEMIGNGVRTGSIARYSAFQVHKGLRNLINTGKVDFIDCHLSQLGRKIRKGYFGNIDCAIVECCKINADGGIVPTLNAAIVDAIVETADKVLLEINIGIPVSIEGIHDFGKGGAIHNILDRIGDYSVYCDPGKIAGIVFSDIPDPGARFRDTNELYESIAGNVVKFLENEVSCDRLPREFTFQSGMGGVANAVMSGLSRGGFSNLSMFTEVLTDAGLGFVRSGMVKQVSTTALDISHESLQYVYNEIDFFKKRVVLRPLDVTNAAENISEMNLVSMNTAVEVDIYGNVNSTNVMGSKMLNGLGGSNDFCRNAGISIFTTPSTAKDGAISSIVPMVAHVDSTEHDTDIIITEYGIADLRGKCPRNRVSELIENCAHPEYRKPLWDYYNGAVAICGEAQTPHDLSKALSWHQRFLETGSMK